MSDGELLVNGRPALCHVVIREGVANGVTIEAATHNRQRRRMGAVLWRIANAWCPPDESAWTDAICELRRLYPDDDKALATAIVEILREGPL